MGTRTGLHQCRRVPDFPSGYRNLRGRTVRSPLIWQPRTFHGSACTGDVVRLPGLAICGLADPLEMVETSCLPSRQSGTVNRLQQDTHAVSDAVSIVRRVASAERPGVVTNVNDSPL